MNGENVIELNYYGKCVDSILAVDSKYSGMTLAIWNSGSAPARKDCNGLLNRNGDIFVKSLTIGSQVCGKTGEGRIFYIRVTAIDDAAASMVGYVTVWSK